jgi:hypothetical protein
LFDLSGPEKGLRIKKPFSDFSKGCGRGPSYPRLNLAFEKRFEKRNVRGKKLTLTK